MWLAMAIGGWLAAQRKHCLKKIFNGVAKTGEST